MQIAVHTDNTITGHEALTSRVASEVEKALATFESRMTRVEVHLSDESAGRPTENDMRCVIEAFLEGQSPAVASHHANTLDEAVLGAAHRLDRVLESRLARLSSETARRHA